MKSLKKKIVALAAVAAMLGSSAAVAQEEGAAYYDSYGTAGLSPAIALGVITVAAVIAVIINNGNEGNAHSHFHSPQSI